jgi:SAM-dependent methyltransferase
MKIYDRDDSVKPKSLVDASLVDLLSYIKIVEILMEYKYFDSDSVILDCFSGSGYGAYYISQFVNSKIIAIDGSIENLEHANKFFGSPRILNAVKKFPFELPVNLFDMHEIFINVLIKSLKPGGRMFISTPSPKYSDYESDLFPSHFCHPDPRELISKCSSMELVRFFGLDIYRLAPQNLTKIMSEFYTNSANEMHAVANEERWSNLYEFRKNN